MLFRKVLRRVARERFSDWTISEEKRTADWTDCQMVWRGGLRRGRVCLESGKAKLNRRSPTRSFMIGK